MRKLMGAAILMALAVAATPLAQQAARPGVSTPKAAFGFNFGDDYQLANYKQIEAYWKTLDRESDRMALHDMGAPAGCGGRGGSAVRPEYADRLAPADLAALEQFIRGGGTLICLNSASNFAIQQLKLPVRNVATGLRTDECFLHGTIVEVTTDPSHQVMAGMAEKSAGFADSSPVFETLAGFKGRVLAKYQESGSPLLSGYLIGENVLHGTAAALDVQLDSRRMILLGFRPAWRGQPLGAFKILFNAALAAGAPAWR